MIQHHDPNLSRDLAIDILPRSGHHRPFIKDYIDRHEAIISDPVMLEHAIKAMMLTAKSPVEDDSFKHDLNSIVLHDLVSLYELSLKHNYFWLLCSFDVFKKHLFHSYESSGMPFLKWINKERSRFDCMVEAWDLQLLDPGPYGNLGHLSFVLGHAEAVKHKIKLLDRIAGGEPKTMKTLNDVPIEDLYRPVKMQPVNDSIYVDQKVMKNVDWYKIIIALHQKGVFKISGRTASIKAVAEKFNHDLGLTLSYKKLQDKNAHSRVEIAATFFDSLKDLYISWRES